MQKGSHSSQPLIHFPPVFRVPVEHIIDYITMYYAYRCWLNLVGVSSLVYIYIYFFVKYAENLRVRYEIVCGCAFIHQLFINLLPHTMYMLGGNAHLYALALPFLGALIHAQDAVVVAAAAFLGSRVGNFAWSCTLDFFSSSSLCDFSTHPASDLVSFSLSIFNAFFTSSGLKLTESF